MRIIGIIVFVVGVVLLVLGISATNEFGQEVMKGTTGHYSNQTIGYIIGGVVLIIGGLAMAVRRRL